MSWLWDFLTRTPRYQGKNCWKWADQVRCSRPGDECETAFRTMGFRAAPALIALFESALRHSSRGDTDAEQERAAEILAAMGTEVLPEVLRGFLSHPSHTTRASCGNTLQKIGPSVLMPLADVLGGGREHEAMVSALLAALARQDYACKDTLIWALTQLGTSAVPGLRKALSDSHVPVRQAAIDVLGRIGTTAVLPALEYALDDESHEVRYVAVLALAKIGTPEVVPGLAKALSDERVEIQVEAIEQLSRFGPPPLATLLAALGRDDPNARVAAVRSLIGLRRWDIAAVGRAVGLALQDTDAQVRGLAASSLHNLGMSCLPLLIEARQHARKAVRQWVEATIKPPENQTGRRKSRRQELAHALPALFLALTDKDCPSRSQALDALGKIESDLRDEVRVALGTALEEGMDSASRLRFVLALTQSWEYSSMAISPLSELMKDPDPTVRRAATQAMSQAKSFGGEETRRVQALLEAWLDTDEETRECARQALESIDVNMNALVCALDHREHKVQMFAIIKLGGCSWGDPTAMAALERQAKNPDEQIRQAAAEALQRIRERESQPQKASILDPLRIPFVEREVEVIDDELAARLAKLTQTAARLYDQGNMVGYHQVARDIKEIGQGLAAQGGDRRMQEVAERVRQLGGSTRQLELFWQGIGGWQF
jgi:HEAT repeat protein